MLVSGSAGDGTRSTAYIRCQYTTIHSTVFNMVSIRESFSAGEAAKITGVPYRNLDHWARTKFIVPSISEARGTGSERKYAFDDLVALRVARELREGGISTQALRRVVDKLRHMKGLQNPLASSRLVVVGSDVKLVNSCEEVISLLDRPGQAAFAFMVNLERTIETIKTDVRALRAA
jgi:DNA-binding transcriptional MerR regulator